MSLLLESIRLENGKFFNLFYHEQRMVRSLDKLCGIDDEFDLEEFLMNLEFPKSGLYKCRIEYDEVSRKVEFLPYQAKVIKSLKVIENDRISYDHKYLDRKVIDKMFAERGTCDDILIVRKNKITDASYANIVFKRNNEWFTPWSSLLKGTMRQLLIEEGKIQEEEITVEDLASFESCKLINAMLQFDSPEIQISNIER